MHNYGNDSNFTDCCFIHYHSNKLLHKLLKILEDYVLLKIIEEILALRSRCTEVYQGVTKIKSVREHATVSAYKLDELRSPLEIIFADRILYNMDGQTDEQMDRYGWTDRRTCVYTFTYIYIFSSLSIGENMEHN